MTVVGNESKRPPEKGKNLATEFAEAGRSTPIVSGESRRVFYGDASGSLNAVMKSKFLSIWYILSTAKPRIITGDIA
jgi:hypothetical protein